jgi:hypothetical protein
MTAVIGSWSATTSEDWFARPQCFLRPVQFLVKRNAGQRGVCNGFWLR